ncbi:sterol desaturase family protein [Caenimonas sedimenti]|uniref:Sterol desaturase family protein n=1 Tax=Caenimonas sedimenti TaxID=2596921 RepID=A0A562ZN88_9BURK|nr:sterol desaturase family protein [Caenimonas sedimenti]TWO69788.1 sterol desaturase family protein [Caenimonas sedimenti]
MRAFRSWAPTRRLGHWSRRSGAAWPLLAGFAALVLLLEAGFELVDAAHLLIPRQWPTPYLGQCLDLLLHLGVIGFMLALVERLFPGSASPKRYLQALWFWAWYIPVAVWCGNAVHDFVTRHGIEPLLSVGLADLRLENPWQTVAGAALVLLGAIVLDFFVYWFHRMQHAVPLLWAFHSTHHANRSLNGVGSYHHPLEDVLRIPFMMLPLALTIEIEAPQLAFVSAFVATWGFVNHMDTHLHFGPLLRNVFADPWYHRVHHSLATEHYDKNFAGTFSLWDRLFGTQVLPPADAHQLPVGLVDVPHPEGLRDYLFTPLRVLSRRLRPAKADATDEALGKSH